MKIKKLEQSGLILTSNSGFALVIDIAGMTPLESIVNLKSDAMLVSHIHGDHFSIPHILALKPEKLYTGAECLGAFGDNDKEVSTKQINEGDVFVVGDFEVTVFEVDHGPNAPTIPEQNFGFLIREGEESLYFAGDMFTPSGIDVADLDVTYALLPVGGHYTFDHNAALDFARTFKSIKQLSPIHFADFPPINTNADVDFKNIAEKEFNVVLL